VRDTSRVGTIFAGCAGFIFEREMFLSSSDQHPFMITKIFADIAVVLSETANVAVPS
jgi:hypothetical protein